MLARPLQGPLETFLLQNQTNLFRLEKDLFLSTGVLCYGNATSGISDLATGEARVSARV